MIRRRGRAAGFDRDSNSFQQPVTVTVRLDWPSLSSSLSPSARESVPGLGTVTITVTHRDGPSHRPSPTAHSHESLAAADRGRRPRRHGRTQRNADCNLESRYPIMIPMISYNCI